jgi:hypothetical protein
MTSRAKIRCLLFWAIVTCSVASAVSDDKVAVFQKAIALVPIDVTVEHRETIPEVGSSSTSRFRFDGARMCYLRDLSDPAVYEFNKQETMFDGGEIIRLDEMRASEEHVKSQGLEAIHRMLSFKRRRNTLESFSLAGAIVTDDHCPVVGCIDGYFFSDYFPLADTKVEISGATMIVSSETLLGKAVCKFDLSRGAIPIAFEVDKSGACYTTGRRIVNSVKYDVNVPSSALIRKKLVLSDVVLKSDPNGKYYMSRCKLMKENFSERGLEGRFGYEWNVTSIDLSPKFELGKIRPELNVTDGERFVCSGEEQLPYMWSSTANWVVPMSSSLVGKAPVQRNSFFFNGATLLVTMCVLVWFLWLRK